MENEKYYTKELTEKIYVGTENNTDENNYKELLKFFKELVERKRNDPIEGGLQAAIIILSDSYGAKINENDGSGAHFASNVNIVKHLKKHGIYLSESAMSRFNLHNEERKILYNDAVEIRVLDGKDKLMIAITSKQDINGFKQNILNKILQICYKLHEEKCYRSIEIGITAPDIQVEFTNLNDDSYEYIISQLKSKGVKK